MSFFTDQIQSREAEEEGKVPRDRWDRPLILLPDGSGKSAPYARASSFGGIIEDKTNLEKWGKRQMIRGVAIDPSIIDRVPQGPARERGGEISRTDKKILDRLVDQADAAVGSSDKAELGTAIHLGTELVDLGGDLTGVSPLVRERATAYWHFCQEYGLKMTSVETFGVEDTHRVAGTWDRTGTVAWDRGIQRILDVKTSSTMAFAGIGFAVQLAEYAHMFAYDPTTGARTPHETMHMGEAYIIHVSREQGGPVELFRVDIEMGWRHAGLVAAVKAARAEGKRAIDEVDALAVQIEMAQSRAELHELWAQTGASWTGQHKALATLVAGRFGEAERP